MIAGQNFIDTLRVSVIDIDIRLSQISPTGFKWDLVCFHTDYYYGYHLNWMATWHPDFEVIEF